MTVKSIDAMTRIVEANGGTIVLPKQGIGEGMGGSPPSRTPRTTSSVCTRPARRRVRTSDEEAGEEGRQTASQIVPLAGVLPAEAAMPLSTDSNRHSQPRCVSTQP